MQVTIQMLKAKPHCQDADKFFPLFERDYPTGTTLGDLLDKSEDDAPDFFEWLVESFHDDIEVADYSGYCLQCKSLLVKHRPDLIGNIGYDAMTEKQKRYIDLFEG